MVCSLCKARSIVTVCAEKDLVLLIVPVYMHNSYQCLSICFNLYSLDVYACSERSELFIYVHIACQLSLCTCIICISVYQSVSIYIRSKFMRIFRDVNSLYVYTSPVNCRCVHV